MKKLILASIIGLFTSGSLFAQFAGSGTTTVLVTVANEAAIQIDTVPTTLTPGGAAFSDFTGTTYFTYKLRTTKENGLGSITLKVTSDFSPNGGPSANDALTYTCAVVSPGTGCGGTQPSSTTSDTPVANFGHDSHSAAVGTGSNSVNWTLTNNPLYQTGSYSATVTFTISAS